MSPIRHGHRLTRRGALKVGLEQGGPVFSEGSGGGVEHVDGVLIVGQRDAAGLAGLLDRAHQPVVLTFVAPVGQCDALLVVGPHVERG